jgi:hypothetical protein
MGTGEPPMADLMRYMPRDLRKRWQSRKRMGAEGVLLEYVPPGHDRERPWRRVYRAGDDRTLGWVSWDAVIRYTATDPNDMAHYEEFNYASRHGLIPVRSYSGVGGAMRWLDRIDKDERANACVIGEAHA